MKNTLLALFAFVLPLTFSEPTATAALSDDYASAYISQTYESAIDAYNERPSNESYYTIYYSWYSSYYLYYGAAFDNDTNRYYGYLYAYYAFYYASLERDRSVNNSLPRAQNVYEAYYYSYCAYYYAYYAYLGY